MTMTEDLHIITVLCRACEKAGGRTVSVYRISAGAGFGVPPCETCGGDPELGYEMSLDDGRPVIVTGAHEFDCEVMPKGNGIGLQAGLGRYKDE